MSFEKNVFINCPFDEDYRQLLRPLLFTVLYLGLEPQISQTVSSGNIRIQEIKKLIRNSMYSIHDISRCKPMQAGDLQRFNMPFELGIDIGCQTYGNKTLRQKKCLILETEKYYYQKVISDVSGQDIKDHRDDEEHLILNVREWFVSIFKTKLPGATKIWDQYNEFLSEVRNNYVKEGYTHKEVDNLSVSEFIMLAKQWDSNL